MALIRKLVDGMGLAGSGGALGHNIQNEGRCRRLLPVRGAVLTLQ